MNADVLHGYLYADEYNGNFCIANVTIIFVGNQSWAQQTLMKSNLYGEICSENPPDQEILT
jgi:hypothetical protein